MIRRLQVAYVNSTSIQGSILLPKTLEHLCLEYTDFDNLAFLSNLSQLTSLELVFTNISNDMCTDIAEKCSQLKSFKIVCEYFFKIFLILY